MRPELEVYLDRLRLAAFDARDFTGIPQWLETHTKDPVHNDRKWSFREHEYQIQILADDSPEISMQKCSQVGASEIWVRMMLAMMIISKKITIIYILPSSAMSKRFSSGRIQPVIDDSPTLKGQVDRELNNAEQKRIGRSLLYISGTYGQSAAISVPAQALFRDEVDFCNPRVLTTYDSRLGHSKEGEALKRSFSTPTVYKYGINLLFEQGSQAHYMVKHNRCGQWVAIDYFRDVVIPGYENTLRELEREDLIGGSINIGGAFFLCPHCRNEITHAEFCDPANRQWVHAFPDRHMHHSYQVLPIDVPTINPLARTLRQLNDYDNKKDWVNFKVGLPYEDAQSSFLEEAMNQHATTNYVPRPEDGVDTRLVNGCHMGVDVGKTSWCVITRPNNSPESDVVYAERVRQDGDNYAGKRISQLFTVFGCIQGVIDSGPDISLAQYLVQRHKGKFMACRYDNRAASRVKTLDVLVSIDEEEGIVVVNRTGLFDGLVRKVNKGTTRLTSRSTEFELMKNHLKSLKRIELTDSDSGEYMVNWVNTGDDHYGHALGYADVARRLREVVNTDAVTPYIPSVGGVRLKYEGHDEEVSRLILPAYFRQ